MGKITETGIFNIANPPLGTEASDLIVSKFDSTAHGDQYTTGESGKSSGKSEKLPKLIAYLEATFRYRFADGDIHLFGDPEEAKRGCRVEEFSSWLDVNFCISAAEVREWAALLKDRDSEMVITFIQQFLQNFPDSIRLPDIHPVQNAFRKVFPNRRAMILAVQNLVYFSDYPDMIPFLKRYAEITEEPVSLNNLAVYLEQKNKSEGNPNYWANLQKDRRLRHLVKEVFPATDVLEIRQRIREIAEGDSVQYENFITFLNGFRERFGAPDKIKVVWQEDLKTNYMVEKPQTFKNRLMGAVDQIFWLFLMAQEPDSLNFLEDFYRTNHVGPPTVDMEIYFPAYLYHKYVGDQETLCANEGETLGVAINE